MIDNAINRMFAKIIVMREGAIQNVSNTRGNLINNEKIIMGKSQ